MTGDAPKTGLPLLGIYSSVGETVLGQYQVLEQVGQGGMGQIYKAQDLRLSRIVALKFLPPWKRGDPKDRERLTREAKYASTLNHPNIVTIYDIAECDSVNFIVMEFIPGETLDCLIPSQGLPVALALEYAVQIADALTAAHSAGILHGDLKPRNIMINGAGRVKLLDFGLAKELTTWDAETREPEADRFGTAIWLAPEQLTDLGAGAGARTEIFSLGLIFHQMLSGHHPFGPGGREEIENAIRRSAPRPLPPEVPRNVAKIVEHCLEKDVDRRFHAMEDVLAALNACPGAKVAKRVAKTPPDEQQIREIVRRIEYKNVVQSGQALKELRKILRRKINRPIRDLIREPLRELILTVEPDNNGVPAGVRKVRKMVFEVLKISAEGNLSALFSEGELETLDLYAMDFSDAQVSGVNFNTCFLPYANFRNADLSESSFQGSWVRNACFTDANLTHANLSNMDWFNAVGFSERQLLSALPETVLRCPRDLEGLLSFLEIRYRFSFDSWQVPVQQELRRTWNEYLRPGGLCDLVGGWRGKATR